MFFPPPRMNHALRHTFYIYDCFILESFVRSKETSET
jgi:hypothetical protein